MSQTTKEIIDIIKQGAGLNKETPATYLARKVGNGKASESDAAAIATEMGLTRELREALALLTIRKGDIIIDNAGKRGVVTELRSHGFFARPEGLAYKVSAQEVGGSNLLQKNATVITATWFTLNGDGSYSGTLL